MDIGVNKADSYRRKPWMKAAKGLNLCWGGTYKAGIDKVEGKEKVRGQREENLYLLYVIWKEQW